MEEYKKCMFCAHDVEAHITPNDNYICRCENCGEYNITHEARMDLPVPLDSEYKGRKHLIAGYLREMAELGSPVQVTTSNYSSFVNDARIPKTTLEKLNKLLLFIYRRQRILFGQVDINLKQPAIAYAQDNAELMNMLEAIVSMEYAKRPVDHDLSKYVLTPSGIRKVEDLERAIDSKQGFVAMWFTKEMDHVYNNYIAEAIQDAGYKPLNISRKEHNDDICDHIIAEIRRSKFVVADFTGHRGGAYYEAGFAFGLGLEVIHTCRKDWFQAKKGEKITVEVNGENRVLNVEEDRSVHFDINHKNFIVWQTGEELYEKLRNRILATIL